MAQAVVLMGIQASGKSSFYRERFFRTHLRINLDMLNTRNREATLLACCLDMEQSFVVDNTNPTRDDRQRYLPRAAEAGFRRVGYVFAVDVDGALERNAQREGDERIPDRAIYATAAEFEEPSVEEGFDELHRVEMAPDGGFRVEPWAGAESGDAP